MVFPPAFPMDSLPIFQVGDHDIQVDLSSDHISSSIFSMCKGKSKNLIRCPFWIGKSMQNHPFPGPAGGVKPPMKLPPSFKTNSTMMTGSPSVIAH